MSYIIAIANEKGGVGKTTTALSLGAAFAERNLHVLLIDLDPQSNLTLSLGLKPASLQRTMADVLMGGQKMSSILLRTGVKNVEIAPANQEMQLLEQFLRIRENFDRLLQNALHEISHFDLIIIDCPPAIGALTQSALTAANLHILPTQCEYFSANAIGLALNMIRYIRQRTNPALRYRLLLTMIESHNRVHQKLQEHIRKAFGNAVFNTVIEMDSNLRECQLYAQPITAFAPKSRGALQYRELAQEIYQYARETVGRSTQAA
jgi:chromosome partitioning protein